MLWTWCTAVSCIIVGRGVPPIVPTILAVMSAALVGASVYLYNDIVDREMDKMNAIKQDRPLVSGAATVNTAYIVVAFTGLVGLLIGAYVNMYTFLAGLAFFVVFFVYSHPIIRLKKMFIIKELTLASGFIWCSLIGSTALIQNVHFGSLFAGAISGLFVLMCTPAINDAFDIEEDKIYHVRSLATALSWQRRVQLMGVGLLFMMVTTVFASMRFEFSTILPISVVVAGLLVLRFLPSIYEKFEVSSVWHARQIFKYYFFFTQIMFVVASFNIAIPFL